MTEELEGPARNRTQIIAELEALTQEQGFIHAYAQMAANYLWYAIEDFTDGRFQDRLNEQEMAFLLGLAVKRPIASVPEPSTESADAMVGRAVELMGMLHQSFSPNFIAQIKGTSAEPDLDEIRALSDEWDLSGEPMIESIFYGGSGAYREQLLHWAGVKYAKDSEWLESHLGVTFESLIEVAQAITVRIHSQVAEIRSKQPSNLGPDDYLNAFSFEPKGLPGVDDQSVRAFLKSFTSIPGEVNPAFINVGSHNEVFSQPVIELPNGVHLLFAPGNAAFSLYESPFYWMMHDPTYVDTAVANRGDTTEEIAFNLLAPFFGSDNIWRNVIVTKNNSDIAEIDVLARYENKGIIVQAKSKRLTQLSRQGDTTSLESDFRLAVQSAYGQGLSARSAISKSRNILRDHKRNPLNTGSRIDDAHILCLTLDHYPAIMSQSHRYLRKKDADPHPVSMSIFDLEIVCNLLGEPTKILHYVRQRSRLADYFMSDSEMSLLGFHLLEGLCQREEFHRDFVPPEFAQLVDQFVLFGELAGVAEIKSKIELLRRNNDSTNKLASEIKAAGRKRSIDALYLLYDLPMEIVDRAIVEVQLNKQRSLQDGKPHQVTFQNSDIAAGVVFVTFPLDSESMPNRLERLANALKYVHKADEWLAIGCEASSPSTCDLFIHKKHKWRSNGKQAQMARLILVPGADTF